MKRLLLAISLGLIIVVAGCGAGTDRNDLGTGSQGGPRSSVSTESKEPGSASTIKVQKNGAVISSKVAREPAGDLVIKSDNQVLAGSKQAMVDQIDKEMDGLMDSLNKLESVDNGDLEME